MSALSDILNAYTRESIGEACLTKIALAIAAGGSANVASTGTITYVMDGVFKTKSALAAQSIAVTHDCFGNPVGGNNLAAYVQPSGTTVYYLVGLDAAGNVSVTQGSYAGQAQAFAADPSKVLTGKGGLPVEPAGVVAIGLLKVVTTGGATFTPGTTALDAANVTVTYFDIQRVPSVAP